MQHPPMQPPPMQHPPMQQPPLMQHSSIQIPVGPPPPKVVSTATIVPTAYPAAPGSNRSYNCLHLILHARSLVYGLLIDVYLVYPSAPVPAMVHTPAPIPPAPAGPAPASGPSSGRPPWVIDGNFANKFDPSKPTTKNIKVQPLPQAAPPPPAYIPNPVPAPAPAPAAPSPAFNPAPFPPVARGVAQRAERFAASSRTPLCGACNSIIRYDWAYIPAAHPPYMLTTIFVKS